MKNKNVSYIPNELANAAKDGFVTSSELVKDYFFDKSQEKINEDTYIDINAPSSGLKDRISAFEDIVQINIGGDEYHIINNVTDIQPGTGGIPTANAVAGISSFVDSTNWIYVIVDITNKILGGIKQDGSVEWNKGVPTPVRNFIEQNILEVLELTNLNLENAVEEINNNIDNFKNNVDEHISFIEHINNEKYSYIICDLTGNIAFTIDKDGNCFGKGLLSFVHEWTDYKNMLEATVDNLGLIAGYRKLDGTRVEKYLEVDGMNANSRLAGVSDWSNEMEVTLPIPEEGARINLIIPSHYGSSKYGLAEAKGVDWKCKLEYWDNKGNYFRKPVIINAQGNTSMAFEIPNQAIDIDDGSTIKFGEWVALDSFHLKKYFLDSFRGLSVVAYRLIEQVYQTRDKSKPWLSDDTENISNGKGKMKEDFNTGALMHPDGFPVELFRNGESLGVYVFALKKHRDNYYMKKTSSKNILLDGILGSEFWQANGELGNKGPNLLGIILNGLEVRNPKNLVYSGAHFKLGYNLGEHKYDGNKSYEVNSLVTKGVYYYIAEKYPTKPPSHDGGQWEIDDCALEYDADIIEADIMRLDINRLDSLEYNPLDNYEEPTTKKIYKDDLNNTYLIDEEGKIYLENDPEKTKYELKNTTTVLSVYSTLLLYIEKDGKYCNVYPGEKYSADIVKYGNSYFVCTVNLGQDSKENIKYAPSIMYRIDIPNTTHFNYLSELNNVMNDYDLQIEGKIKGENYRYDIKENFNNGKFTGEGKECYERLIDVVKGDCEAKIYNDDDNPDFKNKTKCGWLNCTASIKVTNAIAKLTKAISNIDSKETDEDMRNEINKYFDVDFVIDYLLTSLVLGHSDGFRKNWIWGTWDGEKWLPTLYDCDSIFGVHYSGIMVSAYSNGATQSIYGTESWSPTKYMNLRYTVNTLYETEGINNQITKVTSEHKQGVYFHEACERYAELRDMDIFSVENIMMLLENWIDLVGYNRLEKDYNIFPDLPSYRDMKINSEYWELYEYTTETVTNNSIRSFSSSRNYVEGDLVYIEPSCYYKCILNTTGTPVTNPALDYGTNGHWELINKPVDVGRKENTPVKLYLNNKTFNEGDLVCYTNVNYCYKAKKNVPQDLPPCKLRTYFPQEGGFYNSIYRVKNWLEKRIIFLDEYYNYNK